MNNFPPQVPVEVIVNKLSEVRCSECQFFVRNDATGYCKKSHGDALLARMFGSCGMDGKQWYPKPPRSLYQKARALVLLLVPMGWMIFLILRIFL